MRVTLIVITEIITQRELFSNHGIKYLNPWFTVQCWYSSLPKQWMIPNAAFKRFMPKELMIPIEPFKNVMPKELMIPIVTFKTVTAMHYQLTNSKYVCIELINTN